MASMCRAGVQGMAQEFANAATAPMIATVHMLQKLHQWYSFGELGYRR